MSRAGMIAAVLCIIAGCQKQQSMVSTPPSVQQAAVEASVTIPKQEAMPVTPVPEIPQPPAVPEAATPPSAAVQESVTAPAKEMPQPSEPPAVPEAATPPSATVQEPGPAPVTEVPQLPAAEGLDEASLQARQAMEQSISRSMTQAADNTVRNAETIIAQNRWGFSVYDPATNSVEYYAGNGVFLGKRDKS